MKDRAREVRNVSEEFNRLAPRERLIACIVAEQVRLQHLEFERDRLKAAYRASLEKINDHKRNIEAAIVQKFKELDELDGRAKG